METVYFGFAMAAFVLAGLSLIVCVFMFFRTDAMDAIRYLRHKPVKNQRNLTKRKDGRFSRQVIKEPKVISPIIEEPKKGDSKTFNFNSGVREEEIVNVGARRTLDERDVATDSFGGNAAGNFTSEESEKPTGILNIDASENETDILIQEDSEEPTGVLGFSEEISEQPTGLLVNQPQLDSSDERRDVDEMQCDGESFRFVIRQNIIEIHTEERIE